MPSIEQWILFALLILWAALLIGGFIFGKDSADHTHRMPTWTRMGSSLMLVIATWVYYLWINSISFGVGPQVVAMGLFFAIGMTLGFIGDLFMAELIIKGENHVLGGIAAFGLGHIAYIAGIIRFMTYYPDQMPERSWLPLAIWLGIGLIGWFVIVFLSGKRTIMHYAALPYTLLLASTVGVASVMNVRHLLTPMPIGAALFLLSDLILAAQLFRKLHFRSIGDMVWFTYGPGQMLLVMGMWLASPLSITWYLRDLFR